jgi:hypothetical protein
VRLHRAACADPRLGNAGEIECSDSETESSETVGREMLSKADYMNAETLT